MQVPINIAAADAAAAIRVEQVRSLYANIPASVVGNALIALILANGQWSVVAAPSVIAWLAFMMLTLGARMLLLVAHRRRFAQGDDRVWLQRFRISIAAVGAAWGLASLLIFPPHDIPHQAFLTFALGGVTSAAITTLSIDRVSLLAFTLPALAAVIVRLFVEGTAIQTAMGVMGALFLLFTVVISQRAYRTLRENVVLRISIARREQELNSLVESAPDNIIRYDLGCRAVYVNHRLAETMGVVSSLIGKTPLVSEFNGVTGVENYQAKLQQVIDSGEPQDVEVIVVNPDGDQSTHHVRFVAERGSDGGIIGALAFGRDITERKQAEVALQESEKRYRALLLNASDAILIADMNGNLEEINHAGELLLGYSRDQICGMSVVELHPADEQAKVRQHFEDVATKGNIESLETKILRKDGLIVDVEIRPTLSEISGRKVAQAIFIDLTERKRIEKDRSTREAAQRDALVREVHHRIKNNLQGITGILRQFADNHPETAELFNHAISQVQSVAVVHGLQGRAPLTNIRLCELIVAIAAGFELMWKTPVTVEIPECWISCIVAETEAVPLALVLNELICNAVKHGGAEGHVRVMLSHESPDSVRLTIHNTGLIPAGFGLGDATAFGTGLQLVSLLLPRTGSRLTWAQQGGIVVTTLDLDKPVIQQE